jgi:nitrogen fixation/metabolism regulation signal transduction histidine kinase
VSVEPIVLAAGVVLAAGLLGTALAFLIGNHTLRSRLVAVFVALALVPALLSTVILWWELQPRTWRSASRGIGLSLESALVLARNVLADRQALARDAAEVALQRLEARHHPDAADLTDLLPARYVAFFCAGEPGRERVLAVHGAWTPAQAALLMHDVLPAQRTTRDTPQLVTAPDSAQVVVGAAGPVLLEEHQLYALVVLALPEEEAHAIRAVVESYRRAQQLGLFERLLFRHVWFYLGAVALVFLMLAFGLGIGLGRTLTRPIVRLQQAFEAVAAGQLGHQVDTLPRGEMGRLTERFNEMSRDLETSHDDLVRATRLAAWQDVARRLAHEIKNPLTPITLSIHRLRTRLADQDEVVRECLDTVLEEASHLHRLADEFSSFARTPKPKLEKLDPAEILQQVLELYSAHPEVRMQAQLEGLPHVLADRDQIRQVFTNVVKNAVEAMPGGGNLEVHWAREDGAVALTFLDQGCGFPEAAGARVFDPTFTTKPTGSGLGLAIVRRILEDHGGDIEAGNRGEGGAWVRIRLRAAD